MSTKIFAFTSLLALASALPATPAQRRRDITDCSSQLGTQFYRCANGYVGCFSSDPCALPAIPTTTFAPSTPTATVVSTPTATALEITQPRSYNIYPQGSSDTPEDKVPHVDLHKTVDQGVVTTNAIIFDNVPANAINCHLNWRSNETDNQSLFWVVGNGLIYSRQLLGVPETVTFEGLKSVQNTTAVFSPSMDTTNWNPSPGEHGGPVLKCATSIAVELHGVDNGDGEDRVFIANTDETGMYLTYDLV